MAKPDIRPMSEFDVGRISNLEIRRQHLLKARRIVDGHLEMDLQISRPKVWDDPDEFTRVRNARRSRLEAIGVPADVTYDELEAWTGKTELQMAAEEVGLSRRVGVKRILAERQRRYKEQLVDRPTDGS